MDWVLACSRVFILAEQRKLPGLECQTTETLLAQNRTARAVPITECLESAVVDGRFQNG